MIQWDCPGLQLAIHREGTLNKSKDKDKQGAWKWLFLIKR